MITTSCKGCVFATYTDEQQSGCQLGRADKLTYETDENGNYMIQHFCNTYRPEEWLKELSLDDYEARHDVVLEETVPRVGFFIIFDPTHEIAQLRITLEDIQNQTITPRYVAVINSKVEYNPEIQAMFKEMFNMEDTMHHIVQVSEMPENHNFLIDEAFTHAKNGWLYINYSNERIDRELISKMHTRINFNMKPLVIVKPYEGIKGLLFQTSLFKLLNGNKTKVHHDQTVDNRLFLEKVEEMPKDNSETITTWSQFNEA